MNTTTIDDLLDRIAHEGKTWTVQPSGKIRLDASAPHARNVCPLTSLYREEGVAPYYSSEWVYVAARLGVALDEAHALVEAADCSLPALRATGARDWQLDLRRRLLHACHLPPEGEEEQST